MNCLAVPNSGLAFTCGIAGSVLLAFILRQTTTTLKTSAVGSEIEYYVKTSSTPTAMLIELKITKLPNSATMFLPHQPTEIAYLIDGEEFVALDRGPIISLPYDPLSVAVKDNGRIISIPMREPVRFQVEIGEVLTNGDTILRRSEQKVDQASVSLRSTHLFWENDKIQVDDEVWNGKITIPIQLSGNQ